MPLCAPLEDSAHGTHVDSPSAPTPAPRHADQEEEEDVWNCTLCARTLAPHHLDEEEQVHTQCASIPAPHHADEEVEEDDPVCTLYALSQSRDHVEAVDDQVSTLCAL